MARRIPIEILSDIGPISRYLLRRTNESIHRLALRFGYHSTYFDRNQLIDHLNDHASILFLCYGNICRSPFAERYFEANATSTDITVSSAGFHPESGRSSPQYAITAADRFGVDLSDHASRVVTEEMVQSSDLVLLMDVGNYLSWTDSFGDYDRKAYFLGCLQPDGDADFEIHDPYGNAPEFYQRVYAEIATAVDHLLDDRTDR